MLSQKPRLMPPLKLKLTQQLCMDLVMDTQDMDMVTTDTLIDISESDLLMQIQRPRPKPLLMPFTDMDMATTHVAMVMVMVVTVDTTMDEELENVETIIFQNCFKRV